jgi:hypothetical protein
MFAFIYCDSEKAAMLLMDRRLGRCKDILNLQSRYKEAGSEKRKKKSYAYKSSSAGHF